MLVSASSLCSCFGQKNPLSKNHVSPDSPPSPGHVLEVLIRTIHPLHNQIEMHLAELDIPKILTGPRLRFLITVEKAGKIRMSEIATKIGIKPRTVTQFVDALELAELIVRAPDPDDRRATFLQLSDSAPSVMRKAKSALSESAIQVLGSISPNEPKQLLDILLRLSKINNG